MKIAAGRFHGRTSRLISSRWPTVGVFDAVADPEDIKAVIDLESLTNDRLVPQKKALAKLSLKEWVTGEGASMVMAAFAHPAPGGGRFNREDLGAWYCSPEIETAIDETLYHWRRRIAASEMGEVEISTQMREYVAHVDVDLDDVRGGEYGFLYHDGNYMTSQQFGEERRASGSNGILYHSVRRAGGTCLCLFRPKIIYPATQANHYEYKFINADEVEVKRITNV